MKTIKIITCCFMVCISSFSYGQLKVAQLQSLHEEEKEGVALLYQGDELFTGSVFENYVNGHPKMYKQIKDGLADGVWREWYTNGQLKFDSHWKDGKGHGTWIYYFESGQIRQEEFYQMDKPNGIFRDYYNNGQVKVLATWMDGKKYGLWKYFNEEGILLKTESHIASDALPLPK